MITEIIINYENNYTLLCEIGKKYDTDKSSIRTVGHSHPYTNFYYDLLKDKKDEKITICEVGIFKGGSLNMWGEYFKNAKIVGFDNNYEYIDKFNEQNTNKNITTDFLDIQYENSIKNSLEKHGPYDIIIEDTNHFFDDQIRFIKTAIYSLKKGGTLIIEDIFVNTDHRTGKVHSKDEYQKHLNNDIFKNFKKVYLVTLNHINKRSPGWNNDRLLVFENKL